MFGCETVLIKRTMRNKLKNNGNEFLKKKYLESNGQRGNQMKLVWISWEKKSLSCNI